MMWVVDSIVLVVCHLCDGLSIGKQNAALQRCIKVRQHRKNGLVAAQDVMQCFLPVLTIASCFVVGIFFVFAFPEKKLNKVGI